MKTWMSVTSGLAMAAMLTAGAALAQTKSQEAPGKKPCDGAQPSAAAGGSRAASPERIDGQVTGIDAKRGMVTVRAADGQTHEFQASQETLKDLKVGDRLEAKLRPC